MGADECACTDTGASANHCKWADVGARIHACTRADDGGGVYSGDYGRQRMQPSGHARVRCVRVFAHQGGDRTFRGGRGLENDGRRARVRELAPVTRAGEKGDCASVGVGERGNAVDARIGVAMQFATESYGKLPE